MTRGQRKFITSIIAVAVVVLIVIGIVGRWKKPPSTQPATETAKPPGQKPVAPPVSPPVVPPTRKPTDGDRTSAAADLAEALALLKADKLIEARSALADVLNRGALSPQQADHARSKLAAVVETTLLGPQPFKNDPCVIWYKFEHNDTLIDVRKKLKLPVPWELLQQINRIPDVGKIDIGRNIKCIGGPFHAVIYKSRFIMDVYLEEPPGKRMIFVKRLRVGLGKDDSTPTGLWRVAKGRKMKAAPWTPPVASNLPRKRILYGQPGYPLGQKGYWISLEGIEPNPHTAEDGYGIHGTSDRGSIGKALSMGCIRLTDEDIEQVYAMLYYSSKVDIRE